ncbi:probable chromodomain-helicase-DNA-binding protein 4 at N-terminal half [Coccomyxa sp. Obi]|nr:probable chromodomain-helicase-DNA-binding protein 4 at N-terminal half [Coccomyxa sp. Obi]
MNGLTHISPVEEMPDSKMAARVGPAQTLGPPSAEQDVDCFGRKGKLGKRELKALGENDVDLTAGRPMRRLKTRSDADIAQAPSSCSGPSAVSVGQTTPVLQPSPQPGTPKGSGRGRRAAALHAAEAIAAQAQDFDELEGDNNADAAGWTDGDGKAPAMDGDRGSFDPLNSPVIKGPRTARKKNFEHLAGGFANSMLLRQRSSVPLDEDVAAPPAPASGAGKAPPRLKINAGYDEALKAALVEQAAAVRDITGVALDKGITLREVLKGGALCGQPVFFQSRHGNLTLTGDVTQEGQIACHCKQCRANGKVKSAGVSCSEFEEHAGSRERRPGESIYLTRLSISLKEFCALVNDQARSSDRHGSYCGICMDGGDLLCCDGCPTAVHPFCIGLEEIPDGEWFCEACVARGVQPRKPAASPQKPAKQEKFRQPKPAGHKAAAKQKKVGSTGAGAPKKVAPASARVHMAAPAVRVVSGARRERNSNKHKRLFLPGEPGGLTDGEPVSYITSQGEELLKGSVRIDATEAGPSGILCECCNTVISCSQFEAHAGRGSRRAPYDNIFTAAGVSLRKLAQAMPSYEAESPTAYRSAALKAVTDRKPAEPELVTVAGDAALTGGCVLCDNPDFLRGGFGDRTMIICDQCEREFHIGCLAQHNRAHLTELPEGDWHCSPECAGIAARMHERVSSVAMPLEGEYSWQILRGKDGTHATTWALKAAQEILTESFDPILDLVTGADLMMAMVYAQELGDWDYTGMYTAILRRRGKPVCSAVFRVFGGRMAEVPLVATRLGARRQGHARVLMTAFEDWFRALGVACLCLPAAQSTVDTWIHGFGFTMMTPEQLAATRSELRVLIFPGTELLYKSLNGQPLPDPPERTARAEKAAAASEVPNSGDAADDRKPAQPTALEPEAQPSTAEPAAAASAEEDAKAEAGAPDAPSEMTRLPRAEEAASNAAAHDPASTAQPAEQPISTALDPQEPGSSAPEMEEAGASVPGPEEPGTSAQAADGPGSNEQQEACSEQPAEQPQGRGGGRGRGRGRSRGGQAPPHRKTVGLERRSTRLGPGASSSGPVSAPARLSTRHASSRTTRHNAATAPAADVFQQPATTAEASSKVTPAPEAATAASTAEDVGVPMVEDMAVEQPTAGTDEAKIAAPPEQAQPAQEAPPAAAEEPSEQEGPGALAQAEGIVQKGDRGGAKKGDGDVKAAVKPPRKSLGLLREVLSLGETAAREDVPLFPVTWGGSAESTRSRSQTTGRPSFGVPSVAAPRSSAAEADLNTEISGKEAKPPAEHLNGVIGAALRKTRQSAASEKSKSKPLDAEVPSGPGQRKRKASEPQGSSVASRTRQKIS